MRALKPPESSWQLQVKWGAEFSAPPPLGYGNIPRVLGFGKKKSLVCRAIVLNRQFLQNAIRHLTFSL